MKLKSKLGMSLLAVWLIITGLSNFMAIPIPSLNVVMGALAVASGILILLGR